MDGVVVHVEEKWLLLVFLDECNCFLRLPVGKVLSFVASGKVRDTCSNHGVSVFGLVERIEVVGRLTVVTTAEIEVIALPLRIPFVCAQMPFADMAGHIAGRF